MQQRSKHVLYIVGMVFLLLTATTLVAFGDTEADEFIPTLYGTWVSVLPPLLAIVLALITKEVYSSLFLGVLAGGLLYAGSNFSLLMNRVFVDGIIGSLSDSYNVGILVFLVVLGVLVALMNSSGGSAAFGRWASNKIRTREGAQRSTICLGLLIFVDDYFNCLTVGSVMRPLTDGRRVSRAKLAYLIDATAAPICIIAPISSWAAAVSGFVEGQNGFQVFIKAIPYNFYALFTIVMMFALVAMRFDYGKMAVCEKNAIEQGDLFTVKDVNAAQAAASEPSEDGHGRVSDLIIPIIILIISCLIAMIYTGGFFSGESFVNAFADCDASVALVLGSMVALVFTVLFYTIRRVLPFTECMNCLPEGFKAMVSPIMVLTLAWTLKTMTDGIGLSDFVYNSVGQMNGLMAFLPAVVFLIGCVLGIASGTSWGTFGILIPIAITVTGSDPDLMIMAISACMAGAVCGDHCSPISDTTIMSSAGAGCNHLQHVETQFPYAMTVAGVSTLTYVLAGIFWKMGLPALTSLPLGLVLLLVVLFILKGKAAKATDSKWFYTQK